MERVGLVARVEEQLEWVISLGRLPKCGTFGSQEKLARNYGVSRSTVREALRRLAARGLVVQHPGRKTRAVALDEALTLENLGVALHDERSPESRRLLAGYLSLKRQVTLELLTDCCAHASEPALQLLTDLCFALADAAQWESGERCAQLEFELLRLAARAVDRPGHVLLIQSLHRAFQGIADRVLPLVNRKALLQWTHCAMLALGERDSEALKRELPPLLKACDSHIPSRLAPASEEQEVRGAHRSQQQPLSVELRSEALAHRAQQVSPPEEGREAHHDQQEAHSMEPRSEALAPQAARGLNPSEPDDDCAGEPAGRGSHQPGRLSDRFVHSATGGSLQPEPPSAGSVGPPRVAVRGESEPLHGIKGQPPPTSVPESCAPRAPPLPTPQDSLLREQPRPFMSSSRMKASTPSPEE